MSIKYKYNENAILNEIKKYIDSTYSQHYSHHKKLQTTEFIIDSGHGIGFCLGNIFKYGDRYDKKGTKEDARKDLMKIIHYAIMAIYIHDETEEKYLQWCEDAIMGTPKTEDTVFEDPDFSCEGPITSENDLLNEFYNSMRKKGLAYDK